jgi:uncharacterized membrane protein (Fun14 family)
MFENTTDAFTWADLSQLLLWGLAGFLIGVAVKRYGKNILLVFGGFFLFLSILDYYNATAVSWSTVQESFLPLFESINDGLVYLAQNLLAAAVFIAGFTMAVRNGNFGKKG